jgi:hypothetical protein
MDRQRNYTLVCLKGALDIRAAMLCGNSGYRPRARMRCKSVDDSETAYINSLYDMEFRSVVDCIRMTTADKTPVVFDKLVVKNCPHNHHTSRAVQVHHKHAHTGHHHGYRTFQLCMQCLMYRNAYESYGPAYGLRY